MTSVTICPHCKMQVGIPAGTDASAKVECPLCSQMFQLAEAYPEDLREVAIIDPGEIATTAEITTSTDTSSANTTEDDSHSPVDDQLETFTGMESVSGDAVASTPGRTTSAQPKQKKGPGPLANMIGMVVFGLVGLGLGFGVLLLFGKADPIIKMFPPAMQTWFAESNDSDVEIDQGDSGWKIGGKRENEDETATNQSLNSNRVTADGRSKNDSADNQTTKRVTPPANQKKYRTFTDQTGKHHTEAYLVKLENNQAYLEKRDGEIKEVPLEKFSKEDRRWIRNEIRHRNTADK